MGKTHVDHRVPILVADGTVMTRGPYTMACRLKLSHRWFCVACKLKGKGECAAKKIIYSLALYGALVISLSGITITRDSACEWLGWAGSGDRALGGQEVVDMDRGKWGRRPHSDDG